MGLLSTEERRSGAASACPRRLLRRLILIGGFVLLGWLALAIVNATQAAASPDPSPGAAARRPAATARPGDLLATVDTVLNGSVPSRTDPAEDRAIEVPVPGHAAPPRRTHPALPTGVATLMNELPVVGDLARSIESGVAPVTGPVSAALDPVSGLADPVTRAVSAVSPALTPLAKSLSPVVGTLDDTIEQTVRPVSGLATRLAPAVEPVATAVRQLTGDATGPPARAVPVRAPAWSDLRGTRPAAGRPGLTGPTADRSPPQSAPQAQPASAYSASVTAGAAGRSAGGTRVPAPTPTDPPAVPGVIAVTSGTAATSNPGTGANGFAGCGPGESWAASQVQRLGAAGPDRSHAVRNSAAQPPVWPD